MARPPDLAGEPWPIVVHLDRETPPSAAHAHVDRRAGLARRHRVLDAVLDERLHRERWDSHRSELRRRVELVAEPVAESYALDLEVVSDDAQLLAERDRTLRVERESQ